jgi:DNA repair protein RadD
VKPLWDHQKRGILGVQDAIAGGHRRILLVSPTGGGKTRMVRELVEWALGQDRRACFYTNRRLLVGQAEGGFEGLDFGVRMAGERDEREKPFQVSSVPTEGRRVFARQDAGSLRAWQVHDAWLNVFDEAHIQRGKTAVRLMDELVEAGGVVVGVTATPLDLGGLYDHMVVAGTNSELRDCGALVWADHYGPDEPDRRVVSRVPVGEETLFDPVTEEESRKAIMLPGVFGRVFDHWKRLNPDARPAILFAPGVKESIWFAQQFERRGVKAAHLDGETAYVDGTFYESSRGVREDVLGGSRDGRVQVVCNRFVLREGVDCPWLFHGILACVFGNLGSYLQAGGRLLRADPTVDRVVVQDHGGNWWRYGSLNADREWELGGTARVAQAVHAQRARDNPERQPAVCPACGAVTGARRCHLCGHVRPLWRPSRMVVQADGSLVEHVGHAHKPRAVRLEADTQDKWKKCYYQARNSKLGMTFQQAIGLFVKDHHYWPPMTLKLMPANQRDLFRRVADVPPERLL